MKKALKIIVITAAVLLLLYGVFEFSRHIRFHGTPSTELWLENAALDPELVSSLSMTAGEDFKILIMADIQLDALPIDDPGALKMVRELIETSQPDFIMTVGDNTSWSYADAVSKKLIKIIDSYGIPWGVTFGNHDSEGRADREWHGNRYEEAEHSLFRSGPSNIHGIGNYAVSIKDPSGNPVYNLIMMDTNENRLYEQGWHYGFLYYDQIKWYEWMIKNLGPTPSMVFFHIPLPEFDDAVEAWHKGEIDPELAFGEAGNSKGGSIVNTGFFESALKMGSTTHMFAGHLHRNNLSIPWKGIRLTYTMKTGPTYSYDPDKLGGTMVTIKSGSHEVEVEHIYMSE